jgi:hypothetical protein
MSVNRNHWGAKPYQLAFVTTVLVAWGKAEVDPYSTFSVRLDLDNETKRGENRRLLHFAWNFGSARKRQGSEAVRHDEDLLISSQPDVGYCLQASLITVLPVCYAGMKRNFKKKQEEIQMAVLSVGRQGRTSGPPSGGKKRRDRSHE